MATIKKKRQPKQTLAEFRAWLLGVEELQPENWSPNRDQWVLIRGRIDKIIAPEPEIIHIPNNTTAPNKPVEQSLQPGMIPVPPPVGGIPQGQLVESLAPPPATMPLAPEMPSGSGTPRSVTQNIDTTHGNYASGFE